MAVPWLVFPTLSEHRDVVVAALGRLKDVDVVGFFGSEVIDGATDSAEVELREDFGGDDIEPV